MNITIQCFGIAARLSGADTHELCLRDITPTVGIALQAMVACYPELAPTLPRCACAVNDEFVNRDHPLADGDVMALLPPVSGG